MFLPLRDRNKLKTIRFQQMTLAIILANTLVYIVELSLGPRADATVWANLGFVPARLLVFAAPAESAAAWHVPGLLTLVTHSFLHEDFLHLGGNMLFLWVFGDNVEDALGSWRFLGFYLIAGAMAALVEAIAGPNSGLPLIGASGAISACIGAYILLYPRAKIWILLFFRIPLLLPAYVVVGIWVMTQIAYVVFGADQSTAWFAHLGGFTAGALMVTFMRRPGVNLFNPADPKPVPVMAAAAAARDRKA